MKKLFISFDYEGMGGVCNWKQTIGSSRYNELITEQINAFLKGVYESEPDAEVVLCDSHGDGNNIIYEKLVGNTYLISGYPRQLYMMEGIDRSYDGVIFMGYHAPIGQAGNMDHTYSSSSFYQVRINGQEVAEANINALIAAHFGVPLLFVYTDDVGKEWMQQNLCTQLKYLSSKNIIARYAAQFKPYQQLLSELYQTGKSITEYSPCLLEVPSQIVLEIDLADTNIGYAVQMIPGVKAVNPRSISITCRNPLEMYQYLMTCVMVSSAVKNYYK
ncbi:MAG: M55 family metallopeptidase [Candidatus Cloacimonetes bacterium]|nr:M55 family metallopeptidase [Candidatus Cloacimonadota bacterium]